jgi:integrase
MRPEEVFRMRIEHLDFKLRSIFNPYGKTKAARRTIPMTDDALSLLKRKVKEGEQSKTPYVFPSPHNVHTDWQREKSAWCCR